METMNYFMEQELEREAWEKLSREFHWTEETLKKCSWEVDWKEVSDNDAMYWTDSMLETFKDEIDWKTLSRSRSVSLLRADMERTVGKFGYPMESGTDRPFYQQMGLGYIDS